MIADITTARDEALSRVSSASSVDEVARLDAELLGKKGALAGLKAGLGKLATVDEKKAAGAAVNEAMTAVEAALAERRRDLGRAEREIQLAAEALDLTEYIAAPRRGRAHIVTQAWERLEDVFVGLGFQVAEGPEVETDWYNFEALNMPPSHPARSMHDTFYVDHGAPGSTVLRTHTSPVQIRVMQLVQPPIYMVMPGRVFRNETTDATHLAVFHQIEGLVIDRGITLADLAGTIDAFTKAFFGTDFGSRLRPSYFPFTEPEGRLARIGWLRHGAPQRAARRGTRSRGMERFRLRLRNRPHGQGASRGGRRPRDVHQRHPVHRAVLT
ncbi:MAG: phenylalanyl-tRNA synthetase alpha chain [Actinomycetota bacterium]